MLNKPEKSAILQQLATTLQYYATNTSMPTQRMQEPNTLAMVQSHSENTFPLQRVSNTLRIAMSSNPIALRVHKAALWTHL